MSSIQDLSKKQYFELFRINQKLLTTGEKYFTKFKHPSTARCDVLMGLVAKMTRSHRAVVLLVENGFGLESSNNTRSMFEDCVNLIYVLKNDNESRAKRYMRHGHVQRFFLLDKVKNKKRFKRNFPAAEYEKLEKKKRKFWKYYRKPHQFYWSGKSLKKMCKNIGFQQFYEIYYDIESHHPHAQPILIGKFIKSITDTQQTFSAGPEINDQEGYLISAFNWLHKALSTASIFFNNETMQKELKELQIELDEIVTRKYK